MVEYRHVTVAGGSAVGRITLNRPEVGNALTPEMMGEIAEGIAELDGDEQVRVVIIDAAGRHFSAGGDMAFLDALANYEPFEIKHTVYRYFGAAVRAVKLCAKPTIAAVQGAAAGAGCEIALAADFRIAGADAFFQENWIQLGLICPLGGMFLLPRLVGLAKATEMLMLGDRVDAEEALRIGLVNKVVDREALPQAALALADRLAAGAPLGLAAVKEGLRRGLESTLAAEWEHNVYVQSMLIDSADFAEALAARKEKRPPQFRGR